MHDSVLRGWLNAPEQYETVCQRTLCDLGVHLGSSVFFTGVGSLDDPRGWEEMSGLLLAAIVVARDDFGRGRADWYRERSRVGEGSAGSNRWGEL